MNFETRISRLPRPYELDRASEVLLAVPWAHGSLKKLIAGAAGSAPYLHGLILRESLWLEGAVECPETALRNELSQIDTLSGAGLRDGLRQAKRRVALLAALCDLAGVWDLFQVTGALSDLADHATHAALKENVAREISKGKIPGQTENDIETCGGMVALAMGKHGAGELNYSSDIDLICLFDESRFDANEHMEARAGFIRATRRAMADLSDLTSQGYVFRTDLRLRPSPSVTPVCFAMEAAERYYESIGRTWERAAFIKARAAAGDTVAGDAFLQRLSPFVWRRHLDFAAIQETHDMRLKIREHKGLGGAFRVEGHNVKLGLGGIREIEFFAQTQQLISGGRDPDLRSRETIPAMQALAHKKWVSQATVDTLSQDYIGHREIEHRLQMLRDQQTHSMPTMPEEFDRLAALMGTDSDALRGDVQARCLRVHEMTEAFFAPNQTDAPVVNVPDEISIITENWSTYACLRSERAQDIFDRLFPELLDRLHAFENTNETLLHFDGFLKGLPAGVQLFSLFESNPQLIDLILDICATAPHLAIYLSRNAGVLDAVIGGHFFAPWRGLQALHDELLQALEALGGDYEAKLDVSRRWAKDWHFRIGVHQLRDLISADEAGQQYADIARASLSALYPHVVTEFSRKYGMPPGKGAMVLGMGSLGAGRLTAASDLDMIVIYDADGVEYSEGPKSLAARPYYTRLTQALITAISTQTAEGRLYEVDMRLRPSGLQGPVATSLESFKNYQQNEAWVWEHLALTRATPVAGDAAVLDDVEAFTRGLISSPKDEAMIRRETRNMRTRLAEAKPGSPWDPKNGPGRMMDVELLAEAAALLTCMPVCDVFDQLQAATKSGWLTEGEHKKLQTAYRFTWRMQSAARLLTGEAINPSELSSGGTAFLTRTLGGATLDDLAEKADYLARDAAKVLDLVLERRFIAP